MLRDERHFTGQIFPVILECVLDEEMRRIDREAHEIDRARVKFDRVRHEIDPNTGNSIEIRLKSIERT